MRNITILFEALEIIEERLREPMNVTSLAEACYSSCSGLQKLFGYVFRCTVNDYIIKRRITCASRELLTSERSITEIAFDYQYGSPEAFSRVFKRCWGISPNEFRKTRRFSELLPKFKLEINNGGVIMQTRKPIDISELYDELKKMRGTYVLSVDIVNFDNVNKSYGIAAGDIGIAQAFARLERDIKDDMLLFRIGGDEFAIVTGYTSLDDAKTLAQIITSHNGEVFKYNEKEIPLSLRIGVSRLPENSLNYHKILEIMYSAIGKAREAEGYIGVYME